MRDDLGLHFLLRETVYLSEMINQHGCNLITHPLHESRTAGIRVPQKFPDTPLSQQPLTYQKPLHQSLYISTLEFSNGNTLAFDSQQLQFGNMKEAIVHPTPELHTTIHEVPFPVPGPDEVIIQVIVAGSNPKGLPCFLWQELVC